MVTKISGKKSSTGIHHLSVDSKEITTIPDIANTLGQPFMSNSSTQLYTDKFNIHRRQAEKQQLKFKTNNNKTYNTPFSSQELTTAIEKSSDSAVGPDDIHYQMLRHLPNIAQNTLLHIINKLWLSESFPHTWQQAIVLPIPKADKDKSDPCNYHPIALTSCLCKVMERMINSRFQ